jgi:hypothetical protein
LPIAASVLEFEPTCDALTGGASPPTEQELTDELLDALASCKSAAAGPNGITGRHLRGMLLDSEAALSGTLLVLNKVANAHVPPPILAALRMSLLVALRKPATAAAARPRSSGAADDAEESAGALEAPASPPGIAVRPIAMGQLTRRLTGKLLLRVHRDKYRAQVGRTQLGLERCAAETGYHAAVLKLQSLPARKCILIWDIEHAFGSAERSHGLEGMRRCIPEALPFARALYTGTPAELLYSPPVTSDDPRVIPHILHSSQGFDQGCTQAGPLFCLAYKDALEEADTAFPSVLVSAYYDDSPLVGEPMDVAATFTFVNRPDGPLARANMRMHPSKTHVWSPEPLTAAEKAAFPAGTSFAAPEEGILMWGCPIGSDEFIRSALDAAVAERFRPARDSGAGSNAGSDGVGLAGLTAQNSMACMRMGINTRFDNLLRVVPPRLLAEAASRWDADVIAYVQRFVDAPLPPHARAKVALPLSHGGLGLRSKLQLSQSAYLSAWLACRSIIWDRFPELHAELTAVSSAAAAGDATGRGLARPAGPLSSATPGALAEDLRAAYLDVSGNAANRTLLASLLGAGGLGGFTAPDEDPESKFGKLQKRLSKNIHDAITSKMLTETDRRGQALIRSTSGLNASAWLTAQPGYSKDLVLPDKHMRLGVAFWLGLDLPVLADAGLVGTLCPLRQVSAVGPDGVRRYLEPHEEFEACTGLCDAKGDHVLGCQYGREGRIWRHNNVVNALRRIINGAFDGRVTVTTCQSKLQQHMRRFDPALARPSNHHIPDWLTRWGALGHDDDVGDVAVTGFNMTADSGTVAGASVLKIQRDKYSKYQSAVMSNPPPVTTSQLVPFVLDTAGFLGPVGQQHLKTLGERKAAVKFGGPDGTSLSRRSQEFRAALYTHHAAQTVGVVLMRSQMHTILQAAFDGHRRSGGGCASGPGSPSSAGSFEGSWATAYNATCFC